MTASSGESIIALMAMHDCNSSLGEETYKDVLKKLYVVYALAHLCTRTLGEGSEVSACRRGLCCIMGTSDFPIERIHSIALASALLWTAVNFVVHFGTPVVWPRYRRVSVKNKLGWCNRIVSAAHVRCSLLHVQLGAVL